MSIHNIIKKINPVVNFKNKIYYRVKSAWPNRLSSLVSNIKNHFDLKEDLFIVLAIGLVGFAGFGLGRLSALEKNREVVKILPANFTVTASSSTTVLTPPTVNSAAAMVATETAKGLLVASKTGKKYHFPWCAGASQISEKNKIWFASYEEAQQAGYTAAANCPNLK